MRFWLALMLILAIFFAGCISTNSESNASVNMTTQPAQNEYMNVEAHESYLLFVPENLDMLNDSIIIVGFSPSGDAYSVIDAWRAAAEKRGWPIFASKTYRNGVLSEKFAPDVISDVDNVSSRLGYASPKLVFTGLSGGGQVSHAFAFSYPGKVAAVVTNCGIINPSFLNYTDYYPHNKTVLFIASPTDFRYEQMKKDKVYLESLGWKTGWIEFEGGHQMAPTSTYEQAAEWLEQTIGNSTNDSSN